MKDSLSKDLNDDAVIAPSYANEQYECNGNKLKVIVPTTLSDK